MTASTYKMSDHNPNPPRTEFQQLFKAIIDSGKITRADQQRFMAALMNHKTITSMERDLANQVFELLRSGRLRVVD